MSSAALVTFGAGFASRCFPPLNKSQKPMVRQHPTKRATPQKKIDQRQPADACVFLALAGLSELPEEDLNLRPSGHEPDKGRETPAADGAGRRVHGRGRSPLALTVTDTDSGEGCPRPVAP